MGKAPLSIFLMGLLSPTDGKVFVNNTDLHISSRPEILQSWRLSLSHVPQDIYLTDGTIAENIAFGISSDRIDIHKVKAFLNRQ